MNECCMIKNLFFLVFLLEIYFNFKYNCYFFWKKISYGGMDLNGVVRCKNVIREIINILKVWFYEYRKNFYFIKGEKIMLVIIIKMMLI